MFGTLVLLGIEFQGNRENWGSPTPSGGGSVAINPVHSLPIPSRRGRPNPVANDTESVVPPAPQQPVPKQKVKAPEPDAIPLKSKVTPKPQPTPASTQKYHPDVYKPNQVYSTQGSAAVSPMFAKQGAGTVGVDQNSVLGSRFGAYASLLMERVAEKWRTNGLEGVRTPYAIISVDIFRNGSTRNPRLVQTSGNYQLDTSALRAVTEASPFPPLPAGYERDVVNVEFRFQIQP